MLILTHVSSHCGSCFHGNMETMLDEGMFYVCLSISAFEFTHCVPFHILISQCIAHPSRMALDQREACCCLELICFTCVSHCYIVFPLLWPVNVCDKMIKKHACHRHSRGNKTINLKLLCLCFVWTS